MKRSLITAAIVVALGLGIYQKVYIPKHTFKTTQLQTGNMAVKVNGVGNVSSKDIYKIGSIYGGKVLSFTINEGEFIKKGTTIATVDSVDLKDKIDELDATIKKLDNDIKSLQIDKKSAIATAAYQNEILKKNNKLYIKGAISQLDFEKFKTNSLTAQLKVESLKAKIASLSDQQSQVKASLNGLKERLKRYTIVSPIDGYVTKKIVSNYQIIMPNQVLLEIVNPHDVWIATHIDTRISGEVKVGDSATIKLRSSDKLYKGIVANIKPVNNSVTNEREIDVKFVNLPIPFYLEEQAIVDIDIKILRDIKKVPNSALTIYDEKNGVWILKDKKVVFKPIKILAHSNKYSATKDLTGNETLVIPNPKNKALADGMKIYTKN